MEEHRACHAENRSSCDMRTEVKGRRRIMFERKEYIVERLDGDYAYLREASIEDLKCVARALLPAEIREGSKLAYEMMEYEIIEV